MAERVNFTELRHYDHDGLRSRELGQGEEQGEVILEVANFKEEGLVTPEG